MNDDFLKVAKEAALEAGKVIQKYAGKTQEKNIKNEDPSDFATEADTEAEKLIVRILKRNFPDHNIIAEEGTRTITKSEYIWVVDPLDGTLSFSAGVPFYSVSIGLLKNNEPFLGVIYNISLNQLFWAEKNKGAYLNSNFIKVSKRDSLDEAVASLDYGHKQKRQSKLDKYIDFLITRIAFPYSFGSAAATLAMTAQGILDFYINEAWVWDFVAGVVIVREAGGKVTDFEGKEPDWTKERLNIVASNGIIHDKILKALK